MKLLLYSGLLYLIIIGIVLTMQPRLMFTADGNWKEFGIGRDPERHTWLPFWLFAILSAMLCYLLILILASVGILPGVVVVNEIVMEAEDIAPPTLKKPLKSSVVTEMKPGYYILNAEGTAKKGTPKYIYLGPEPPNLIYNHMASTDVPE